MTEDTLQNLRERRKNLKEQERNSRLIPSQAYDELKAIEAQMIDDHWNDLDASDKSSLDPVRWRKEGNSQE